MYVKKIHTCTSFLISGLFAIFEDIWSRSDACFFGLHFYATDFLKIHLFSFMCISVFPNVCICSRCILGVFKVYKRLLDPLKLEIWMVVSHHVNAAN